MSDKGTKQKGKLSGAFLLTLVQEQRRKQPFLLLTTHQISRPSFLPQIRNVTFIWKNSKISVNCQPQKPRQQKLQARG